MINLLLAEPGVAETVTVNGSRGIPLPDVNSTAAGSGPESSSTSYVVAVKPYLSSKSV